MASRLETTGRFPDLPVPLVQHDRRPGHVGLAGGPGKEILAAHLPPDRTVRNIRNGSRAALSVETQTRNAVGLTEYLVGYAPHTLPMAALYERFVNSSIDCIRGTWLG
jgi:hypothetical protein